jgi:hypothetical protein
MKTQVKMLVAAVLAGGIVFGVAARIVISQDRTITFRSHTALGLTNHYGDLTLSGGMAGSRAGNLSANKAVVRDDLEVWGVKSFIHPHPTDDSKIIRYIAIESGESITLVRGIAKTINGEVIIALPEHFSLVTSKNAPITVILTPEGAPALLYVKQKNKGQIAVAMKKSDFTTFGDVEFAFQVTGVREGFENLDIVMDAEKLDTSTSQEEFEENEVRRKIVAHTAKAYERRLKKVEENYPERR